jgi:hypothetical protein
VLPIGPKVRELKPGRDSGFLRAISIRSTPCFGGEVKPEAPCLKILRYVKINASEYEQRYFEGQIHHFLRQVPPALLIDGTAGRTARELW